MDSERLAALEAHYAGLAATFATRADIEALRAEMHKMSAEGYRWMVASMVGMFLGFGGLYFAANRPQDVRAAAAPVQPALVQPAQAPQPIIIYVTPPK